MISSWTCLFIFHIILLLASARDAQINLKPVARATRTSPKRNIGKTKINLLLQSQRSCFKNTFSCKLIMNEEKAVGCSQCEFSSVNGILKEYLEPDKLIEDLKLKREENIVIMAAESVIFRALVIRSMLLNPQQPLAVIVAEQTDFIVKDENSDVKFPYPPASPFSGDNKFPNNDYSFKVPASAESRRPTNYYGTGVQFLRMPMNIFYLQEEDAKNLRALASKLFGQGQGKRPTAPLLKIESIGQAAACPTSAQAAESSTPLAAPEERSKFKTDSAQCLSSGTCRPIGGYSPWSSLRYIKPLTEGETRDVVAVTAPMDSTAFFHDMAFGAAAEIASVASLMAIVQAVANYRNSTNRNQTQELMYFAFTGQSWGYAGSSRFLDDVANFECKKPSKKDGLCESPYAPNLKFKALKGSKFKVINLGGLVGQRASDATQPAKSQESNKQPEDFVFFKHGFKRRNKDGTGGDVENALDKQFMKLSNLSIEDGFRNSSFMDASQSFQQYHPDADVVTLTNFKKNFDNHYYHSIYDNASTFENEKRLPIYHATEALTKTVIELGFNDSNAEVKTDNKLIDDFIDCLTTNWAERNCSLAKEYLGETEYSKIYKKVSRSNYAGTFVPLTYANVYSPSAYAKARLLQRFMAYHNQISLIGTYSKEELKCTNDTTCINTLQTKENVNVNRVENTRYALCVKSVCIIAESHLHPAFGTGLVPLNEARSNFNVIKPTPSQVSQVSPSPSPLGSASQSPEPPTKPAWTESNPVSMEVCYLIDDTWTFEGMVLGSGLALFVVSLLIAWYINPKRNSLTGYNSDTDEPTEVDLLGVAEVR